VAEGSPAQLKAGLEHELRLEITFEPGAAPPGAPAFVSRYLSAGGRATASVPIDRAGDALAWAQGLRGEGRIGEFALTPASLEDVYVGIVSDDAAGRLPAAVASPWEVSHARAA
jgi:ABC-2 type transport system ATP-binding protein